MIQHPSGDSRQRELLTTRNMIKAVNRCGLAGVAIYPNSDPGHEGIVQALLETQRNPQWRIFRSLPRDDYLLLASQAATLVGNSSSGIIESASLGVPAVNIGDRQRGRLRCGPGVVDSGESIMAIERAIRLAIRRPRPQREKTPYGDGQAGKRIARVCERLIIDISLRRKHLSY